MYRKMGIGLGMEPTAFLYMACFFHVGLGTTNFGFIFGSPFTIASHEGMKRREGERDEKMKKTVKEMDYQIFVAYFFGVWHDIYPHRRRNAIGMNSFLFIHSSS